MIVYSLVAITIAISFLSCYFVWRSRTKPFKNSWSLLLLSVSLAAFIHLYGVWVFMSVYCKYVADICFVSVMMVALLQEKKPESNRERHVVHSLFAVFFSMLVVLYYAGTAGKPYGVVNLAVPFRSGTYFVSRAAVGCLPIYFTTVAGIRYTLWIL